MQQFTELLLFRKSMLPICVLWFRLIRCFEVCLILLVRFSLRTWVDEEERL
ncbi:hypothetical protein ACE6H2_026417 [Prunus campanulata]